jgi:hypothetical protein
MGWQFKEAANVEQRIAFNRSFISIAIPHINW